MNLFKNKRSIRSFLFLFLICIALVIFTQYLLFHSNLEYISFNPADDWLKLIIWNTLYKLPLLERLIYIWTKEAGIHDTANVGYIGILGDIFGNN